MRFKLWPISNICRWTLFTVIDTMKAEGMFNYIPFLLFVSSKYINQNKIIMKKRQIKSLELCKKTISSFKFIERIKGGNTSETSCLCGPTECDILGGDDPGRF